MKKIIAAVCAAAALDGVCADPSTNQNCIVVTATRSMESIRAVPANPTVITARDIAAGHYTSVPEVLQKRAGIFFKNYTDNPSQASADLRGFGDNSHGRVLVLLDGRRLNEADMAAINWSAVPLTAVERIEVLSGPFSVLYGDHAVGGVINIITAKGSEEPVFSAGASAGSHQAFAQDVSASGTAGGLGYTASAGHQSGDGYRDRSAYENTSAYAGLHLAPNEQVSGKAVFSVIDRTYQLPGALSDAQAQADRRQSDELSDVKDTQYNAQLGTTFTPDDLYEFSVDLGYRRLDQTANLNSEFGPFGTYYDAIKDTWTAEPRVTLTLPAGRMRNEAAAGVDWRRETILIDKFSSPDQTTQTTDIKVDRQTFDVYLNDRLFFADDKLILNAGARAGQSRLQVRDTDLTGGGLLVDDSRSRNEDAWTAGLTALPSDTVKFYTRYDRFYRFPFTDEQALYYGFAGLDAMTDLKPERGQNYEAGFAFTPSPGREIKLTAYRMNMENEIRYNPSLFANENLPETLHQGIEWSARCDLNSRVRLDAIYHYTEAEFRAGPDKGSRIPWVPRNQLRASVGVTPADGLTLSASATYTGRMYAINDNGNNGTPQGGYTLFDCMLSYESVCRGIGWNVFAGIDNLFEKEYDLWQVSNAGGTAISHYPAPERTWKAGLNITF